MHIEMIGSTSAGKTTLARSMVRAGDTLGVETLLSDDFMLRRVRLNWVRNEFLRRRIVELLAALACLRYWGRHRRFFKYAWQVSRRAPGSWWYRLQIARVVMKKIGIYEIVRHHSSPQQVVLLDNEGVLQAAHTLFVHESGGNGSTDAANDVAAFAELVPLPDFVISLKQPEAVLVERTLRRGHGRVGGEAEKVASFIHRARITFDYLESHPHLAGRLVLVDGQEAVVKGPGSQVAPSMAKIMELVGLGIRHVTPGKGPALALTMRTLEVFELEAQTFGDSTAEARAAGEQLEITVSPPRWRSSARILHNLGFRPVGLPPVAADQPLRYFGIDYPTGGLVHALLCTSETAPESIELAKAKSIMRQQGTVIAVTGADATGKSTFVNELTRWLCVPFEGATVHVGKPPSAWLTAPLNLAMRLAARLPKRKSGQIKPANSANSLNGHQPAKRPSLLYAVRAVALAWDRRKLLKHVQRLKDQGLTVICDRYPSLEVGAMDSPRLPIDATRRGFRGIIYRALARFEHALYAGMAPPDIVLRLTVSFETARQRNRDRACGSDDETYLEARHQIVKRWRRADVDHDIEISTEGALPDVLLAAKCAVWKALGED